MKTKKIKEHNGRPIFQINIKEDGSFKMIMSTKTEVEIRALTNFLKHVVENLENMNDIEMEPISEL